MAQSITKPILRDAVESAVRDLPAEAAPAEVASKVLRDPIISKATTPIAWYKSQAIWGNILALVGGVAAIAPQIASIFPEWSDPILKWGGLVTLLIGVWNGVSGRITTTRPIK